jgi:hypothetical protein
MELRIETATVRYLRHAAACRVQVPFAVGTTEGCFKVQLFRNSLSDKFNSMTEAKYMIIQPTSSQPKGRALLVGYIAAVLVAMAGWLYFLGSIAWDLIGWLVA